MSLTSKPIEPSVSEDAPTEEVAPATSPVPAVDEDPARARLRMFVLVALAFGVSFGGTAFTIFQVKFLYNGYIHGGVF